MGTVATSSCATAVANRHVFVVQVVKDELCAAVRSDVGFEIMELQIDVLKLQLQALIVMQRGHEQG